MKGENLKQSMILQVTVAIFGKFSSTKGFSKRNFFSQNIFHKNGENLPQTNHCSQQVW
jgi:hypothetical protein